VVGYWRNRSGVLCVPLANTYTVAGAYHTPQQKLRPGGRVCCCPVTAYVRISSWNAYVLLLLLAQSQWRTLRSVG